MYERIKIYAMSGIGDKKESEEKCYVREIKRESFTGESGSGKA